MTDGDPIYNSYDSNLYAKTGGVDTSALAMLQGKKSSAGMSADQIDSGISTSIIPQATGSQRQGKALFDNTVPGYILGFDPKDGKAKFYIGDSTNYLNWDGTALNIAGSISATSGTIGGFTIGATTLTATAGGNTTTISSGATAFLAGPTGSPKITITQAGIITAAGAVIDGTSTVGGRLCSTLASAIDSSGHFIDAVFNTSTKNILAAFTFGASGAIQIGTYVNGASGDLKLSPNGILGRNSSGSTTFSIDGTTGNAIFGGTLSAVTGSFGVITGGTFQTASTGQRVVIDGTNNTLQFYNTNGTSIVNFSNTSGRAIQIGLDAITDVGVIVTAAVSGVGFYYSNTADAVNRGIYIEQTSNGSNNGLPCAEFRHDGHYYTQLINASHSAGGIYIGNSGTLSSLYLNHSANSSGIYLNNSGTGKAIEVYHNSSNYTLHVTGANTGQSSANVYFYKNGGVNENLRVISDANSGGRIVGISIQVENSGAGAEYAFQFDGAANTIWSNAAVGGSQDYKIKILVDGVARYIPCYAA